MWPFLFTSRDSQMKMLENMSAAPSTLGIWNSPALYQFQFFVSLDQKNIFAEIYPGTRVELNDTELIGKLLLTVFSWDHVGWCTSSPVRQDPLGLQTEVQGSGQPGRQHRLAQGIRGDLQRWVSPDHWISVTRLSPPVTCYQSPA